MNHTSANPSIQCSVTQCVYHCSDSNCCSLDTIKVSRCASQVTNSTNTECASFELAGQRRSE